MKKKLFILLAIVMFLIGTVCSANATLFVRGTDTAGNQLIYDSDQDITWYDYTNTENTWYNQMGWANGLTATFEGFVYDDWRLPITPGTQHGHGVSEGEMGHLFYDDGVNAFFSPDPFLNLKSWYFWLGTSYDLNQDYAFVFHTNLGYQGAEYKIHSFYAIAVRDGDVAAPVPEPCTMLLLGTGLVGLGLYRKKKGGV